MRRGSATTMIGLVILHFISLIGEIDGQIIDGNFSHESDLMPVIRTKRLIINDGQDAEINDYPWMAMLLYDKIVDVNGTMRNTDGVIGCAGSLVNRRYILTAAHCVVDGAKNYKLTSVRLGEYDTRTNPDCGPLNGKIVCGRVFFEIPVDKNIPHEKYRPEDAGAHHDIALIRLARKVHYNDYIKPIYLSECSNLPKQFWVAGWGIDELGNDAMIKQKLKVRYINWYNCSRLHGTVSIPLYDSQICAGGFKNESVCPGDSGGPLMSKQNIWRFWNEWIIHGIVSHGSRAPCGTPGQPAVFTKVCDYVPWIRKTIEKYDPSMRVSVVEC